VEFRDMRRRPCTVNSRTSKGSQERGEETRNRGESTPLPTEKGMGGRGKGGTREPPEAPSKEPF